MTWLDWLLMIMCIVAVCLVYVMLGVLLSFLNEGLI